MPRGSHCRSGRSGYVPRAPQEQCPYRVSHSPAQRVQRYRPSAALHCHRCSVSHRAPVQPLLHWHSPSCTLHMPCGPQSPHGRSRLRGPRRPPTRRRPTWRVSHSPMYGCQMEALSLVGSGRQCRGGSVLKMPRSAVSEATMDIEEATGGGGGSSIDGEGCCMPPRAERGPLLKVTLTAIGCAIQKLASDWNRSAQRRRKRKTSSTTAVLRVRAAAIRGAQSSAQLDSHRGQRDVSRAYRRARKVAEPPTPRSTPSPRARPALVVLASFGASQPALTRARRQSSRCVLRCLPFDLWSLHSSPLSTTSHHNSPHHIHPPSSPPRLISPRPPRVRRASALIARRLSSHVDTSHLHLPPPTSPHHHTTTSPTYYLLYLHDHSSNTFSPTP